MKRTLPVLLGLVFLAGCRRSCEAWEDWREVEIGIGTNRFIAVPNGQPVSPEATDAPYFNVALRTWGLGDGPHTVQIEAFVGGVRYAEDVYEGVELSCYWASGAREVGSLRLNLDPADLPPQTAPPPMPPQPVDTGWNEQPVDTGWNEPPVDTGWNEPPVDTGWNEPPVDTGYWGEPEPLGDVQILVTVRAPSGPPARGETWWYVYR